MPVMRNTDCPIPVQKCVWDVLYFLSNVLLWNTIQIQRLFCCLKTFVSVKDRSLSLSLSLSLLVFWSKLLFSSYSELSLALFCVNTQESNDMRSANKRWLVFDSHLIQYLFWLKVLLFPKIDEISFRLILNLVLN